MFRLPLPRRWARPPLRVKGASTPEMGLLLGLVAVLAIVAVTVTGTEISRIFGLSGESLASVALRSETPEDPSANPGTSDPAPEPEEPADMPPVVTDDTVGPAFFGQAYLLDAAELLANDHDPEGQPLTVVSVANDVGGDVSLAGTTITFTPSVPYGGTARFLYTARDPAGNEATARVTVAIGNMPPVAADDTVGPAFINQAYLLDAAELLANDHDPEGQPLTVVSVENDVGGDVSLSDTTITFTPSVPYLGTARFFYTARDAAGSEATALVTVTVGNTPPVAADDTDTIEIEAGTPKTIAAADLLANDSDADGHTLEIESVSSPNGGTVQLSADHQSVTFTPTAAADAPWSFTYTINDGNGAKSTATASGTILPAPIRWVSVGDGATFTSPDGISWTATAQSGLIFNGVTVANGALIAVGNSGLARRSVDGTTWTSIPGWSGAGSEQTYNAIASGGGRVVAVALNSWGAVSTDGGSSWSFDRRFRDPQNNYQTAFGVVWNGAFYVAVGALGNTWKSIDGVTWTPSRSPILNALRAVHWTGSQFVAVGDTGYILVSPDGVSWQEIKNGSAKYTNDNLSTVTSRGGTIVAAGANGTIVVSTNGGASWSVKTCGSSHLRASGHDGQKFVVSGTDSSCYSNDGITWNQGTANGKHRAIIPFTP